MFISTLLSAQAKQIYIEWLSVYHKLMEQGLYFDSDIIRMRSEQLQDSGLLFDTDAIQTRSHELRDQLAPNQAVVISVNLADYGLAEQPPRLLLIRRECISWLPLTIPDVNLAVDTLTGINRAMNNGRNRLSLRTSEDGKPEQAVTNEPDVESLQQTLKETMTGCWQKLSEQLQGYTQISFIGHGHLVGLPWQGYAPPQFEVSYYSGLYAYHQRKNTRASPPALVPTAESPLTLLAYDAEDQPEIRLYHLPAEIAAIEKIWGKECVNRLNDLSEAKPRHNLLLLLGHGRYGDGLAQFLLKDRMLEQHDLMNYPHTMRFLGASACLLGSEKDIGGEPLGLLSLCGCRPDMAFSYGSLLPVDDLSAVCLSILFHCHWKQRGDPQAAIKQALSELASGKWDETAKSVFRDVFTTYLPVMFRAIENAEKQYKKSDRFDSGYFKEMEDRHEDIYKDWGVDTKQIIAEELADDFLKKVTTDSQWLSRLATFTSFWMYS